ncbi:hypothetical protein RJT34_12751 [Clitoria ternatea]|uniref:Uncharacterized protein n=1 Tax=Clitoria ternatea TaxID=43366 RepID=A0AAN9JMA7_CLITE
MFDFAVRSSRLPRVGLHVDEGGINDFRAEVDEIGVVMVNEVDVFVVEGGEVVVVVDLGTEIIEGNQEDVKNAEEDVQWITSGNGTKDMYYQTITDLKHALSLSQHQQLKSSAAEDSQVGYAKKSIHLDGEAESQSDEDDNDGILLLTTVDWNSVLK